MKSPITGKEMILRIEKSTLVFRKETFDYNHKSFYCEDSGESFTTTEMDEFNLNQVYNKYRDKYNIPFPDQIIELRKKYNLFASLMSKILGFGVNSYRNYENGEVPNISNANLINTVLDSPRNLKLLVELNNELGEEEKRKILSKIKSVIEYQKENRNDITYVDILFEDKLPNNFTGYRKPSMERMANMILFFAEHMNPSETMMNKLLFYADFYNYKKTAFSISGSNYMAHNYGPVPFRYLGIFDYASTKEYIHINVEYFGNNFWGKCFYKSKNREFNSELFNEEELKSLDLVRETFKKNNASQIMQKSHEEKAWIDNQQDKTLIDYEYSFNLLHL